MRDRSIPEVHEAKVLRWFLNGETYRAIAERLNAEHQVDTSPGSVHRLVDRLVRGDCSDGVVRTVARIRMNAPRLADKLHQQLAVAEKMAGFDVPVEAPAGITQKSLDFVHKLTVRELKLAGCLGRDAERALDRARAEAEEDFDEEVEQVDREIREIMKGVRRPIPQPPPEPVRASSNGQLSASATPIRSRAQGRNELCACGSGKKFKRCCGGIAPPAREVPVLQALAS